MQRMNSGKKRMTAKKWFVTTLSSAMP